MFKHLVSIFTFVIALATFPAPVLANNGPQAEKEWTFLLFLNGHNNLDSFGYLNVNQMEQLGSNSKVNLVVQFASYSQKTTQRLYIEKDNDIETITSPVVEDLPRVDMGDYNELTKFIKWGVDKYPAKHYFVAVWNHGSGWHVPQLRSFSPRDISNDDFTGNVITTEQLAVSLAEAAKYIGHKIDIYGSDACLMAMAEVGSEMAESVNVMVASEDLEPGEGWPYNTFIRSWYGLQEMTPKAVASTLVSEYAAAYTMGGEYAEYYSRDVTLSAIDLTKMDILHNSLATLSKQLQKLNAEELKQLKLVIDNTMYFSSDDYRDMKDFLVKLKSSPLGTKFKDNSIEEVESAISTVVVANETVQMPDAHGVAFWLPSDYDNQTYGDRYKGLNFHKKTGWGDFLDILNK